jgi:splicing factor U2AF 65 kDa subunit
VVSVYINTDRHFAFVELKSIELTTACISHLDGITFRGANTFRPELTSLDADWSSPVGVRPGNQLKIRRPSDYKPEMVPPTLLPPPKLNLAKLGIVGNTVPDGPDKIFIGGLPYHLAEEQVGLPGGRGLRG